MSHVKMPVPTKVDCVVNPEVEVQGFGLGSNEGDRLNLSLLGIGAGWYFASINLFVSGAISAAWLAATTENGDELARTGVGNALSLAVGKEWWISANWGLGLALELAGGRIPDQPGMGQLDPWRIGAASLVFSATFN